MDSRKTNKVTNCKQFEMLVSLMEKNPEVARGYMSFGNSKDDFKNIWNGFVDRLNNAGPPVRTINEWQKVWNDYKGKIKNKLAHNKKELAATGGGNNKLYTFSAIEESVIDLLMLREVSNPSRKTFGLNSSIENNTISTDTIIETATGSIENEDEIHLNLHDATVQKNTEEFMLPETTQYREPPNPPQPKKKNKKNQLNDERKRMLELQTTAIQETEKHTREIARYTRKMYDIKMKKFELYKEDLLNKKRIRQQAIEIKLRAVKYKERKLAMVEAKENTKRQPQDYDSSVTADSD